MLNLCVSVQNALSLFIILKHFSYSGNMNKLPQDPFFVAYQVSYEWDRSIGFIDGLTIQPRTPPLCGSSPYPPAALVFAYTSPPYATMHSIVSFMGEQF